MLERLAAWFLNTYVADYVGNVDTDQLSIGLLKGGWNPGINMLATLATPVPSVKELDSYITSYTIFYYRCCGIREASFEERCLEKVEAAI